MQNESHPESLPERLLDFREVYERLRLNCKTGHTARQYAQRGLIVAVRINSRVVRYTEASVNRLIAGGRAA